jgi:hypothetical protein
MEGKEKVNDVVKTKSRKTSEEMSLDAALTIIERADAIMKQERDSASVLPIKGTITEEKLVAATCHKVGVTTLLGGAAGVVTSIAGLTGPEMAFSPFIAAFALLAVTAKFPGKLEKIVCPKKYNAYKAECDQNEMFRALSKEIFEDKERKVLAETESAVNIANSILKEQGQEIIYSSTSGYSINSSTPVNTNKWDTVRIEAIRNKGAKAVGVKPVKAKELTA